MYFSSVDPKVFAFKHSIETTSIQLSNRKLSRGRSLSSVPRRVNNPPLACEERYTNTEKGVEALFVQTSDTVGSRPSYNWNGLKPKVAQKPRHRY